MAKFKFPRKLPHNLDLWRDIGYLAGPEVSNPVGNKCGVQVLTNRTVQAKCTVHVNPGEVRV